MRNGNQNYSYVLNVETPMGVKEGKAVFSVNGNNLSGTLSLMGYQSSFSDGTIDKDGNIAFLAEAKTLFGRIKLKVTGKIKGTKMDAVAKTNMGNFAIHSK